MFLVSYDVNVRDYKVQWHHWLRVMVTDGNNNVILSKKLFVKENECCFDLAKKTLNLIDSKDFGLCFCKT